MGLQDLKAAFTRQRSALSNIAADIQHLKAAIKPGMTDEEVAEAQGEADTLASGLEALAAENIGGEVPVDPAPPLEGRR